MKNNSFINYVKKTLYYARKIKFTLGLFIIISFINAVLSIVIPILSAKIIVDITSSLFNQLIMTSIIIFILEIVNNTVNELFNRIISRKISQEIIVNMQIDLTKETLNIKNKEFDNLPSGKFIDRITGDTVEISNVFMMYTDKISQILSNIGVLVTIFILSKYMFIYSLFVATITFFVNKKRIESNYVLQKELKTYREERTSLINELVRGVRDIKVLNAETVALNETKRRIKKVSNQEIRSLDNDRQFIIQIKNLNSIFDLGFIILGIALIKESLLTIPSALIINNFKGKIEFLFNRIIELMEYNKKFELSAERIFEIMDNKKFSKETFGTKKVEKLNGKIEFKDVSFSYTKDKLILNNTNFKINPNEKVAFVGKSGAGKSTIFGLITRLYDANEGEILLDDIKLKDLDESSLRDNMSMITQSPYIFNLTIKENLLIAKPNATFKEIKDACKMADIDDFIESLPDKYDTKLGENGLILSGGQKQRIAIARALLMKTEIILFDESTSSLDNESQQKIQNAIDNLTGEYTILIIAHRLSTIINCDKIFVVDKGKIIDSGTHKELLKKCTLYKNLYKLMESNS